MTALSSCKTICILMMRHGTPGQWWCTFGNHFFLSFQMRWETLHWSTQVICLFEGKMVGRDDHNPLELLQYQPCCQHETSVRWTSSIKQLESVKVFTNHYGDGIVIEHLTTSWSLYTHIHGIAYSQDIFAGKLVHSVQYQKTGLLLCSWSYYGRWANRWNCWLMGCPLPFCRWSNLAHLWLSCYKKGTCCHIPPYPPAWIIFASSVSMQW